MPRRADAPPDPIDILVGETVRTWRRGRGMSQAALGAAAGVTFQQMQKYENGTNRIAASTLVRIAAALGAPPAELLPKSPAGPAPDAALAEFLGRPEAPALAAAWGELSIPQRREVLDLILALAQKTIARRG